MCVNTKASISKTTIHMISIFYDFLLLIKLEKRRLSRGCIKILTAVIKLGQWGSVCPLADLCSGSTEE